MSMFQSIFEDIARERIRQNDLVRAGKFLWNCSDLSQSYARKLAVLSEEVGEVAKEVTEELISKDKYAKDSMQFPNHRVIFYANRIRKELVQVAAVCVAWIEALDNLIDKTGDQDTAEAEG